MELRPYQEESKKAVFEQWDKGIRKILLVLPTGTGKTIVFAKITEDCVRSGKRVLILAHRGELLDQAADKIAKSTGLHCSVEKAEESCLDSWFRVTVGSVQSLMREKRLNQFAKDYFDTIIIDEAHHCISDGYQRVLQYFDEADVLGVTATPDRGDMKNLGSYFESLAYEYTLPKATADASQKLLIDTLSEVQFRVMGGQQSYTQAISEAIDKIANEGVKVQYKGKERNLESVVRMAVVTGVNQAGIKQTLYNCDKAGIDLVLVTAHMGARIGARIGEGYRGHINWQGRVCSISGIPHPEEEKRIGMKILDLTEDTGYGLVDGLGGANCRHSIHIWHEGYSNNPYYDKEGKPLYDTEESNKLYKMQQKQRRMERENRNNKRELQALKATIDSCAETDIKSILQENYDKSALKLQEKKDAYEKFSDDNNLVCQNE